MADTFFTEAGPLDGREGDVLIAGQFAGTYDLRHVISQRVRETHHSGTASVGRKRLPPVETLEVRLDATDARLIKELDDRRARNRYTPLTLTLLDENGETLFDRVVLGRNTDPSGEWFPFRKVNA